jgi:hypothetical protein
MPSIWIPSALYVPRDLALPPPELHLRSDNIPLLVCRHVLFYHSQRSVYLAVFRSFSPAGWPHVNPGPESRVLRHLLQIFLHSPSANLLSCYAKQSRSLYTLQETQGMPKISSVALSIIIHPVTDLSASTIALAFLN